MILMKKLSCFDQHIINNNYPSNLFLPNLIDLFLIFCIIL